MIRAAVHGRLGADPVGRATTRTGNDMWTASLAVDVARDGADEATEWIGVVGFGKIGAELARLRKGDPVAAMGRLYRGHFRGRDGVERDSWSLTLDSIVAACTGRPSVEPGATPRGAPIRRQAPRRPYNAVPRADAGSALADDRVDDLWQGGAP